MKLYFPGWTRHASRLLALGVFLFLFRPVSAQLTASVNGYLSNMQSVMFENIDGPWTMDNLVHNRMNFKAGYGSHMNATLELRNRFLFGETVKYFPGYADMIEQDRGWADMSWNLVSDTSFILNTTIDRAYVDLNMGELQATIGRQRINWGMNFIWNPNDIFNLYSFFDFDYVERPGSDAVRLQYYFMPSAHLEMVAKMNSADTLSYAGLFRFSAGGYDIQLLGGQLDEKELVAGAGFSGYIGPVSLTGEITYLRPLGNTSGQGEASIAGFGASYLTPFKLNIQAEYLYNQAAGQISLTSFTDFYYRNLTVRDLSPARHTFFANLSFPVTPLFNAGMAAMFFPKIKGFFAGPSLDLSLRGDLDLSFILQHFTVELQPESKQKATLGFLRLKWSF
ncbi:MAG: hypothetical protein A2X22_10940 [Bacteroidetes bacterium GWF2_49_14]|nr:MAG: hypothetical protein A2X22_10940 [Bacteroidetes bacterium GWF2_49_14]